MAEGVVSVFLKKLCELFEKEAHLLTGASDNVRLLHEKLRWLSLSLKEADNKCLEDDEVKLWVTQVRAVTFEAEDIIDKFILRVEKNHFTRAMTLRKIGKEIQRINSRLDDISENRSKLGLGIVHRKGESSTSVGKAKRAPRVEEVNIVGIEDEAKIISKMLIEGDARRSVVSIVGMGGLGKTTLAKKVWNDIHIRMHFECFAWIYVSQEFILHDLLNELIKCLKTTISSSDIDMLKIMSEEELRKELSNYLKGRRYLIVIDDIWNREAWDGIEASFPSENNRSKIMLTTRKRDVALHADPTSNPYELRLLTNEECWELLRKIAFSEVLNGVDLAELEKLGRGIARKCCGLPLAVVVIGGLLSRKEQSVHEWKKVLKGFDWHMKEGEDQILGVLSLSYNDLPYYLKMCFIYFAAFPEDSSIDATELLRMWVAEGFVQERGDETVEDVAEDYLLELVHRSLIQVAERHFNGRVKRCRIHDLLRDLAVKKAKENLFLDVYGGNVRSALPTTVRRLSITNRDVCKHIYVKHLTKHLRSLFCFIHYEATLGKGNWKSFYKRFKLLRVIQLDSVRISMVPDEIGDLVYLRYLSVRFKEVDQMLMLPSTISNLYNLQTMIILGASNDILLPPDYGLLKMRQLRHLHIRPVCSPKSKHLELNKLTNLQSLSLMRVGRWITDNCDELSSLRSLGLKGGLGSYQTALSNFIGKQENLESLWLIQDDYNQLPTEIISSHLRQLEKLHLRGQLKKLPPLQEAAPYLAKLVLYYSRLPEDPMAVLENLPKLQFLKLMYGSYSGKKMCCSARGFPVLAVLEIGWCEELEDWTVEEGAIANLRRLKIRMCSKLKMIPEGFGHVATLQELVLSSQPPEFLERVQENGLDWFKIQHIPSVVIT